MESKPLNIWKKKAELTKAAEEKKANKDDKKKVYKASELRLTQDLENLEICEECSFILPDPTNLTQFIIIIKPNEEKSYWYGGEYQFEFKFPNSYPFDPPKVKCLSKVKYLDFFMRLRFFIR